ncbi:MAG: TonB-dependent receptor, partial [Eudoraea sp.]|nr:TonB-dependent receptor [Eudoraea sp.]
MKKIALLFVIHFIAFFSFAQKGNIRGVIIDKDGIAIPGAGVSLAALNLTTVSDVDGQFTLVNIPVGSYSLSVAYLGFNDLEKRLDIYLKETTFITLTLSPIGIRLEGVEVQSREMPGQSRALNTQKSNLNVTNVVSTDQIGKFPDANIGDAVKRISGIAIQVNQGEARDIIIRGLSPELNSVMLNGSRIPSAEGDNRNIQLDLIPSDMIQSIEINKTITSDMDADALGGAVNLVTRTSPQGFRLSSTIGSGLNFISDKLIWNGSFLIGNRSANDTFGWMLSASIYDNDFGSDNIETRWADTIEYNSGELDLTGNPVLEEVAVNAYNSILEVQPRWIQRVRRSIAANFDYQLNTNHSLILKSMYNWRDDWENRFVFEQEILEAVDIEEGDFTIENDNLISFPVLVSRQTRGGINSKRNKNARLEDQRMQNYTLGGDHLFGGVKVDWMTSFSKASEEIKHERIAEFKSEYNIFTDTKNPEFPFFTPENTLEPNDLSSFEYDEIIEENKFTKEQDVNIFVNLALPLDIFHKGNGQFKFGLRSRLKSKLRENNFFVFDQEANFPTLADVPTVNYSDQNYLVGSKYQAGAFANELWLGDLSLQNGDEVVDEFLRQNFTANENVFAAYVLTNQHLSDQLIMEVGMRLEHTQFKATANIIEEGLGAVGQARSKESYNNFMPGIHIKYVLTPQTILRVAWTNTLARPNYVDLVPSQDVAYSDREILLGNSSLNPATSTNFDLIGEYYFESVGIFST